MIHFIDYNNHYCDNKTIIFPITLIIMFLCHIISDYYLILTIVPT